MNLRTLLSLGVLVSSIALPGIASAHGMDRGMGREMGREGGYAAAMHRGFERAEQMGRGSFERGREIFRGPEMVRGHEFSTWRR